MKTMSSWRKIVLIVFTTIVLIRIGYIALRGEVDRMYYTSAQYDLSEATPVSCTDASQVFMSAEERLDSLELIFTDIPEDKVGNIVLQILADDELIYQTNISLSTLNNMEWKKIYVNAELDAEKTYKLVFIPTETCTQIPSLLEVKNGTSASEIQKSSNGEKILDGQFAVNYGYLSNPGLFDRAVMISLWIWLWLFIVGILVYSKKILESILGLVDCIKEQVKPQILVSVLEVIGCFIIIHCSGIIFQAPTQVVLYLISLIATVNFSTKCNCVFDIVESGWKKIVLFLAYIYAAFALVGQIIWIYPLTLKLTMPGFFVFVCTVLWFIPIINSIIYSLNTIRKSGFSEKYRLNKWQFVLISVCILIIPAIYNLIANNPGISSQDTVQCMITQAQHIRGSKDWHPPFYCMLLRFIESVWNSTYAVIFVQYFFWIYVCVELLLYLRKKEIKESYLLALTLFLGLNTANYIHINTIWKDIPYTLSAVWSLIILAKLLIDYDEYRKKWYVYLELIIALVGVSLYRQNGIVPFIMIGLSLVIVLHKNAKVWVAVAISITLFMLIKGPVYKHFEIQPIESSRKYIGLSQDILGVYYAGGEVSEDTLQMITVMTKYNNAEYQYIPTWSYQSGKLNVEMQEFIISYLDTFIKNPIIMARAIIAREDAAWNIFSGENAVLGCVNYYGTMDANGEWNLHYAARKYTSLYNITSATSDYTASSQWISALIWRSGLFTLLGFIAALFMFFVKSKGRYALILMPSIGHFISLLLSTGWSDFRYFWPLNLLNLVLIFMVFVITKSEGELASS